jgi:hypothetical protein
MFKVVAIIVGAVLTSATAAADPLACDFSKYKPAAGLTANPSTSELLVTWTGQRGTDLRMRFGIEKGEPVIREVTVRRAGATWVTIGQNLRAEYDVTSGVRRMSEQQAAPLRALGVEMTPEVVDRNRWYSFWDAPLVVPGVSEGQKTPRDIGLPRKPEEIRRAHAAFNSSSCSVVTDGARLEVSFPGLSMGIFSGSLRFTVYRGTNLIRMDAVAKTDEPWVAYKYEAGLKGFSTTSVPRVVWQDLGGNVQQYRFGGDANDARVPIKAAHRVLVAESRGASLAVFPPPHTFFFSREVETNLGYVWYRKDRDSTFAMGVRQADGEEVQNYVENFALYNAPPGTWQRMAVYIYPIGGDAAAARQDVLAFTHGDTFKPVAGYKTFVNHFHLRFTERLRAGGSLDAKTQDLSAMQALGINIVGLSDFHGDLHPDDPGPVRFKDWKDYAEASRKASDEDFLVTPWEEPSTYFGGHYNAMFPKLVYWSKVRKEGQPFTETDPAYGKVYHTGSADDVQQMLDAEDGYWFHAHPRTKGTTGYPDAIVEKPWVRNDRYLGVAFKPGMGMDLSEKRLCEWRCFDAIDTMNNLFAATSLRPKYAIADVDTYKKGPEDDLYPAFPVNYLRLDRVPGPRDDWKPILKALRTGDFFVTTGEVLIPTYAADDRGRRGVDLSARVRRGRLGRWEEGGSPDHSGHGSAGVWNEALRDPVRRARQSVGPLRGVGFGRQWRVRAASQTESGQDDRSSACRPLNRAGLIRHVTADASCCRSSRSWRGWPSSPPDFCSSVSAQRVNSAAAAAS